MGGSILGDWGWVVARGRRGSLPVNCYHPTPLHKSSRAHHEAGAAAVEAAIVLPLLVVLLLGIVEVGMLLRADVGLTSAARSAARVASAEPRIESFATDAATAVVQSGTGMSQADLQEVWVYRANSAGYPGPEGATSFPAECPQACVRFQFQDGVPVPVAGQWPATDVQACVGNADAVGVRVVATHRPVSAGIIGETNMSRRAVMTFEPVVAEVQQCSA